MNVLSSLAHEEGGTDDGGVRGILLAVFVSSRQNMPTNTARPGIVAAATVGRAYGNVSNMVSRKTDGHVSAGLARQPPKVGPSVAPICQAIPT